MNEYASAVLLGAVQAITEFLPISSSGHLLLTERLLGHDVASPTFDVGLHLGTLLAVLVYFREDWLGFASGFITDLTTQGVRLTRWGAQSRLLLALAIATLPAVLVGGVFGSVIEAYARSAVVVGVMLIVFGVLLAWADSRPQLLALPRMTYPAALLIGVVQAIALIPGVSRSGSTMTAARSLTFDREGAARFSFLLSAPAVAAAAVLELGTAIVNREPVAWGPMLVGALTSLILGWLVIAGLLAYLRTRTLRVFVWYRIGLGFAVLAAVSLGIL